MTGGSLDVEQVEDAVVVRLHAGESDWTDFAMRVLLSLVAGFVWLWLTLMLFDFVMSVAIDGFVLFSIGLDLALLGVLVRNVLIGIPRSHELRIESDAVVVRGRRLKRAAHRRSKGLSIDGRRFRADALESDLDWLVGFVEAGGTTIDLPPPQQLQLRQEHAGIDVVLRGGKGGWMLRSALLVAYPMPVILLAGFAVAYAAPELQVLYTGLVIALLLLLVRVPWRQRAVDTRLHADTRTVRIGNRELQLEDVRRVELTKGFLLVDSRRIPVHRELPGDVAWVRDELRLAVQRARDHAARTEQKLPPKELDALLER